MERSDSRLLDMKSFSLSPNSTMERSDSLNAINTRVLASKNALADQRNGRVGFDWSIIKILQICPNHTYADYWYLFQFFCC
ncbi:hypothetical protein SCA6_001298 [Theobroma cacao]